MSQLFEVHPQNPQPRLLKQAAQILQAGGVAAVLAHIDHAIANAVMYARWHRIKIYVIAQLQQTSTWRGLTLVATASGVASKPEWGEAITAIGLMMAGLIAVAFPDDVGKK